MFNFFKKLKTIVIVGLMTAAWPVQAANNVIDVLVVYTKGVADAYAGNPTTRINQLFQVSNQIYLDSGVDLEIRVAGTLMVDYTDDNTAETALNDITFNRHEAFKKVNAAREAARADMVIFYRPFKAIHGNCGLAWVGGMDSEGDFSNPQYKNYMYSHIAFNGCGDFVTAHELGHNMGLRHSRKQEGKGGTFHYALGYGVVNKFTTIMAYQSVFNVDYWKGIVYKFSNPELTCKGLPCGVDRNDTVNGADASYALNITAPQIANFYPALPSSASSSVNSSSAMSMQSSSVSSQSSVIETYPEVVNARTAYEKKLDTLNATKKTAGEQAARVASARAVLAAKTKVTLAAQSEYDEAAKKFNALKEQIALTSSQMNAALIEYYRVTGAARKIALDTYYSLQKKNSSLQAESAVLLKKLIAAQQVLNNTANDLSVVTGQYNLIQGEFDKISAKIVTLQAEVARALAVYRDMQAKYRV